jgi:predicted O-linked N-acetylglucosamine transferase (SPINDLY family)
MARLDLNEAMQAAIGKTQMGELAEAEALYRRIVAEYPDCAPAHNNLGTILDQQGRLAEAAASYLQAARRQPDYALAHANLGFTARRLGRLEEAIASLQKAILLNPQHARAHYELGLAYRDLENWPGAARAMEQAVRLKPDHVQAYVNLGIVYRHLGKLDAAVAACRRALQLKPDAAEAYNNLGTAFYYQHKLKEAAGALAKAIELAPENVAAHANLANVLRLQEKYDEAIGLHRKAIRLKPDLAELHNNLANTLKEQGLLEEAIAAYRKCLELKPGFAGAHSNLLHTLNCHGAWDAQSVYSEHLRWAAAHAPVGPEAERRGGGNRPIRVGYVSGDFRRHSVAYFLEPILACHDHGRFSITCYSDVVRADKVTGRLRSLADTWRETAGLSDERVCELIGKDEIDILVDLAGHTADNRLLAFARKPAPVQATYLGYPTTTGLAAMDWRITDGHVDPAGLTERYHTERLMRLPRSFVCYRPALEAPGIMARPAGVPITFASFNNFAKVTADLIGLWAMILGEVPSSQLLLKANGLGSQSAQRRIHELFLSHGIAAQRVALRGYEPRLVRHLGEYNEVDVALDTFPYNGTTTTCEALWMGVPVVTLAGMTSVSRVGASLLTNMGLGELVAASPETYVRTAVNLARDDDRRRQLKSTLRQRMRSSPLMDERGFTHGLEDAYEAMCHARA